LPQINWMVFNKTLRLTAKMLFTFYALLMSAFALLISSWYLTAPL